MNLDGLVRVEVADDVDTAGQVQFVDVAVAHHARQPAARCVDVQAAGSLQRTHVA